MTDRFIDSARIQRLQFLEAHLFRYSKEQYEKEQDCIQVYCAKNPKEEVDFAAQKIRNLARTRGYRYREIAIIASDLNTYGNQIEKNFWRISDTDLYGS